ncbi:MAG TPA: type II secretion system secretin GspD [Kiritimatiellia bacterium]|nr:type II secretion system secretin GspD [Kiritimatiellia bacterium]HMO98272.1 type II secretion system secretin GspD [Kiritimatiellia bacterium]HMP96269.1 type II secretion system secretin GspD [Kiritimatiellia bacterium]
MKKPPVFLPVVLALALAMPGTMPAARAAVTMPAEQMVNFSFDQADLRLIIRIVGEITGRRFVVDDRVSGTITVVTPQNISIDEVYPLLLSILESSGYTVVERPEGTHVVPLPEGGAAGRIVADAEESVEGLITKLIRVNHISALDLAKLLEPLVRGGRTGAVSAFGATNHLLITDTAEAIRQLEKLIRDLDMPGASRTMEVIRLRHANAEDLAGQLLSAMRGTETSGDHVSRHLQRVGSGLSALPSDMIVVPVPNANSVVIVGTPVQLSQVRDMVALIDIETPVEFGRLNSIFLKYMSAEEAATTLNALLAKTAARDQLARIAIEHNNANNALIVEASPQDFELVRKLVDDLDRMPQQVMVEVVIAEVSMGKGLDLGVEWNTIDAPREGSTTLAGRSRPGEQDGLAGILTEGIFPQGLSIGVARGTYVDAAGRVLPRIPVMVQALAQDREVKILSNIPLWAQNNTEASVSVVENIPILSSRIEGTGDNRDVIQNIERVDVGIKLKLTPHINIDNEVKLRLNPSIEAIIDSGPAGTQFAPTIAKREVVTTITIPDRSTVVISGLIREDRIKEVSKVPLLGDIPLLGWLFRSTKDRIQRTNLLIFVTPHIIKDLQDAGAVKDALESRAALSVTSAIPVSVTSGSQP